MVEVLEEKRRRRLESIEDGSLEKSRDKLEKARGELVELEQVSEPLHTEHEHTCSGISLLEDTIQKMELSLVEAQSKLSTLRDNVQVIDANFETVEHEAITKSDEIQVLDSQYI